MHKSATKCNETLGKWCKNKHGASKIIDTLETYHLPPRRRLTLTHTALRNPSRGSGPSTRMRWSPLPASPPASIRLPHRPPQGCGPMTRADTPCAPPATCIDIDIDVDVGPGRTASPMQPRCQRFGLLLWASRLSVAPMMLS
jgi:hypothetical protein